MLEWMPRRLKRRLRERYHTARIAVARRLWSFDSEDLLAALRRVGLSAGDIVVVHSSMAGFETFRGKVTGVISTLQEAVGPTGALLMPTMPFSGSAIAYAREGKVFNPAATPSRMGLITEVFRRSKGVSRSLHPTHAVAGWGERAGELLAGHEACSTPCGAGSPYYRLLESNGKCLLLGVDIRSLTLFHAIEEILEPDMPFSPFTTETYRLRYIVGGRTVETPPGRLYAPEVAKRRDIPRLARTLRERGQWRETKVGQLPIVLLEAADALEAAKDLAANGIFCYEAA